MPKNNDDLSNEILALVDDDLMKDDSSDGGRPRRRTKRSSQDSNSELSASSSDFSVNSEDRRRRNNHRNNQESSSEEEDTNLEHLTEVERELLIAEKAEKNQKKLEEQELLSRLSKQKKSISKTSRARVQDSDEGSDMEFVPSSRPLRTKKPKSQAFKEMKDRRIKKKKQALSHSEDSTDEEEEIKVKTPRQQTPVEVDTSPPVTNLEQLQNIILTREALAALLHDRMLKEIVVGCFVSVAWDPKPDGTQVYRLGKITDVIETSHHYTVEQTRTHRALILSYGADSLEFGFDVISNRASTQVELIRYLDKCKESDIPPITINYVKKKEEELISLKGRVKINEDYEYSIRSIRISSDNTKVHLNFKKHLVSQIRLAKENDQPEVAADLEAELVQVEKDLAPLLEKYDLEVHTTQILMEEKKNKFNEIVLSAAKATKKNLDAELKRKRWVDSDDEGGKDNCFNLKPPKPSPKEPFVFPPFGPSLKSNNDSTPLTAWEQAAAQAMMSL